MGDKRKQIILKAIELLKTNREGIRYSELSRLLKAQFSNTPWGTINGSIWDLDKTKPDLIYKPARGLFRYLAYQDTTSKGDVISNDFEAKTIGKRITEPDFYKPFADHLVKVLEECTKAIPLGGSKFRSKWGTPDVIGINAPKRSDIIQYLPEIVSAEIKIVDTDLVTAFGQACSYKLFSHRVYLLIPKDSAREEKSRVEALCSIFGIGLILFDRTNPDNPDFEIVIRAAKHEPDMFYVNQNLKELEKELF